VTIEIHAVDVDVDVEGIDSSRIEVTPVPRFCPRCRREANPSAVLCAACGEAIRDQGYCPICEQFLLQAPGSSCHKHDVTLESGPPPSAFLGERDRATEWVTVATFDTETQSEPARGRLEAEGIPTFVEGSRMGSKSMYDVATGGLKLQVPQSLASDARAILSQTWTPPDADDLEDAWDELGPDPGAFRRKVMKGIIVLILLGPVILVLIALALRQV
jgi:hypothetical protein